MFVTLGSLSTRQLSLLSSAASDQRTVDSGWKDARADENKRQQRFVGMSLRSLCTQITQALQQVSSSELQIYPSEGTPHGPSLPYNSSPFCEKVEVCREFMRGRCHRTTNECRFLHPGKLKVVPFSCLLNSVLFFIRLQNLKTLWMPTTWL